MDKLSPKVAVIGCGNVGMRYAYALLIRGLARQIVIVDLDRKRLEGEVMDLSHGIPYTGPTEITAGKYADIQDAKLVVITAGKKQQPGQSRLDLVKENAALFRKIIPEIVSCAPEAILMVVTNPVDVLSYAAYRFSGKPHHQVIGSGTVLDTARFRFLLARHCGIDARNVHAYILGEHGDSEFPVWSKALIGGVFLRDYCALCNKNHTCDREKELGEITQEVRTSAYRIIERKNETSYGIGLALVRITEAILNDENAILPVSALVEGYLELNDLYMSLPAVLNKNGIRNVLPLELDKDEQKSCITSAQAIRKVIREAGIDD